VAEVDGTPFGRCRLVELLGRGGMAEVWQAYDTAIDRVVALKVLPANFADDKVYQQRFRREAKAAAGLDEPHVVPIHDFGEIDGRLYVTMQLIKGRDLQAVLADGPLPPPRAVGIIEQVASAMHAAHRIGLVHRDVKPSNIRIAENDFAYLIDFGIARAAGETGLTITGVAVGTWAYMAPERFGTGQADPRSDIYALTCVRRDARATRWDAVYGKGQSSGHRFDRRGGLARVRASRRAARRVHHRTVAGGWRDLDRIDEHAPDGEWRHAARRLRPGGEPL
jgi:serine/threonine protein kinase